MTVNIISEITEAGEFAGLLDNIADSALKFCGANIKVLVELLIIGDEEIMQINNETRGINKPTDVLSFPMIDWSAPANKDAWRFLDLSMETDPDTDRVMLGDIVISLDTAKSQAMEFGHALRREVAFLFLHGMLHLLGYDHQNNEQEGVMRAAQRKILEGLGITRED